MEEEEKLLVLKLQITKNIKQITKMKKNSLSNLVGDYVGTHTV